MSTAADQTRARRRYRGSVHWTYALLLINPIGISYRPAPEPGSPLLEEARALAARDDVTNDDLVERRMKDPGSFARLMQERALARRPDHVEAPAGWSSMIAGLALAAVVSARTRRRWRVGIWWFLAVGELQSGLRRDARRRAARRRGVTIENAPRMVVPGCWTTIISLAVGMWPWLRNREPPKPSWPFWLAVGMVREFQERRSWGQAWRTSTGRPVSSDSTAASATADAA
jgi:hypothetical protein